ncbi:MAG: acyltransferase family protein [Prevotella sp.]|nr:acyltransferase family protein [Prevotella sp.]
MSQEDSIQKRIVWVDQLRAVCILLILWFHTDVYYTGSETIPYGLYVTNALTIFYFISGYLFFSQRPFSLRHKLNSIVRGMVVPYFFFTLLLAIPKALVRHYALTDVLLNILTGQESWFVASLIIAELVFAGVLYLRQRWIFHLLPIVALALVWLPCHADCFTGPDIWHYRSALLALPFLYLGYQYHQYESYFQPLRRPMPLAVLLLLAIVSKVYVMSAGIKMIIAPVVVSNYLVFLIDSICIILLAVGVAKWLPSVSWLRWIGSHTLVYYFFCGAVPTFVAMLLPPYQGPYLMTVLPFLVVCLLTSAIVNVSYRFLPYVLQRH